MVFFRRHIGADFCRNPHLSVPDLFPTLHPLTTFLPYLLDPSPLLINDFSYFLSLFTTVTVSPHAAVGNFSRLLDSASDRMTCARVAICEIGLHDGDFDLLGAYLLPTFSMKPHFGLGCRFCQQTLGEGPCNPPKIEWPYETLRIASMNCPHHVARSH